MPFTITDAEDVGRLVQVLKNMQKIRAKVFDEHGDIVHIGLSGSGAGVQLSNSEPYVSPLLLTPSPPGTPEADITMDWLSVSKYDDIFQYNPVTERMILQPGAEGHVIRLYGEIPVTWIANNEHLVGDVVLDFHGAVFPNLQFLQLHTNEFLTPQDSTISIYNLKHTGYQSAHFISGVKDVVNCDIDVTFLGSHSQVIGYLHGRMSNTRIKISGGQVSTCRCILTTFPTAVIESNNVFIGCPER